MEPNALPMSEASYGRVPELLRNHGVNVEPAEDINEFKMLRCTRGEVGILLSMNKPAHWRTANDARRDKVMVAAIGESLFRFWRIPQENRLRREILFLLRELEWKPG
jgi:hypothetical protein